MWNIRNQLGGGILVIPMLGELVLSLLDWGGVVRMENGNGVWV